MFQSYRLTDDEYGSLLNKVQWMYGDINSVYLSKSLDVVYSMLEQYPRVFALRVDLRYADDISSSNPDSPTCFQRVDSSVITRFIESLKSQLREVHRRSGWTGSPSLPGYVWVREQCGGDKPHYHLVLFFNKDRFAFLGDYTNPDADNMAVRIQRAWCSALGLDFPYYSTLAHFPNNNRYIIDRDSALLRLSEYMLFLERLAYLSKKETKDIGDGYRNFGCSQGFNL